MSWRDTEPVAGDSTLTGSTLLEYNTGGDGTPIWHMHQAVPETGTHVPLTNSTANAGVRIEWGATVSLAKVRLSNVGSTWGATRTPKGFKVWGRRVSDGQWTLLDSAHTSTVVATTDTGLLNLTTGAVPCVEHMVWLIGGSFGNGTGQNDAQSLSFLDLQ